MSSRADMNSTNKKEEWEASGSIKEKIFDWGSKHKSPRKLMGEESPLDSMQK